MVEFNRGSWKAVKQKQLVKNTCKFSLQWGNPEWFWNDYWNALYIYMSINENGDVIGITFIKVYM